MARHALGGRFIATAKHIAVNMGADSEITVRGPGENPTTITMPLLDLLKMNESDAPQNCDAQLNLYGKLSGHVAVCCFQAEVAEDLPPGPVRPRFRLYR